MQGSRKPWNAATERVGKKDGTAMVNWSESHQDSGGARMESLQGSLGTVICCETIRGWCHLCTSNAEAELRTRVHSLPSRHVSFAARSSGRVVFVWSVCFRVIGTC